MCDKATGRHSYRCLGIKSYDSGDFEKALEYHEQDLGWAKDAGDRAAEGRAYSDLGLTHKALGNLEKAIEYHLLHLNIVKDNGNKEEQAKAYGNLGNAHHSLGNVEKAVECHKLDLSITKEIVDKNGQNRAYSNLGNAYLSIGDLSKALECQLQRGIIAKDLGDRPGEGEAYGKLGSVYLDMGDFKQALEYHQKQLNIVKDVGERSEQGRAYRNLGIDYKSLGDYNSAIDCHQLALSIAKEVGDKQEEGFANGNLGVVYRNLRDLQEALKYHKQHLRIAEGIGDKLGQQQACGNLGVAYQGLEKYQEALEYHERRLRMAQEAGDRTSLVGAYSMIGITYHCLGKLEKAVENHQLDLSISKEIGDRYGQMRAYANLGADYFSLGDFKNALVLHMQELSFAKDAGDMLGQARACSSIGRDHHSLGDLNLAEYYYKTSIAFCEKMRVLLHSRDDCKISLRNYHSAWYTDLWTVQLEQHKSVDALLTAERGRGQALMDLMASKYDLILPPSSFDEQKAETSDISKYISSQTIFLAVVPNSVNYWVLEKGQMVRFVHKVINEDKLQSLVEDTYKSIGVFESVKCENRSLDEETEDQIVSPVQTPDEKRLTPSVYDKDALTKLYDVLFGPVADLIHDSDVTIVPDGPLFMVPFAVLKDKHFRYLSETLRIRLMPSLTSLKLMAQCPEQYHCTTGALLVGDPWVENIRFRGKRVRQLPSAREEVDMIGNILKTEPLTGKRATKSEVLGRLASVSLVHIAAHGCADTGEIILSANPTTSSKKPKEEDFLLTMKDVLTAKLQARLVVLSCCHSGRGEIKAEGVVGIARAFLGAGARSVLVSLWAIDDKATQEFMKHFYQHLLEGQNASESLNQAMKCMRESNNFSDARYWAPFVLIGDDVTLNFSKTK